MTLSFSGVSFTFSSKVRAPLENFSNKLLYEWPHYQFLVDRVIISLGIAVICGIAGLMLWIVGQTLTGTLVGSVFVTATCISAINSLTMMLAHQKLREFIDR